MTHYPLLVGFRETIIGKGFLAVIVADGRALAVEENGEWWINGVNPGAIAEGGKTLLEAHGKLLHSFRVYLTDVAEEVENFEAFKGEVERFFNQCDSETLAEWTKAVGEVRANKIRLDEIARVSADTKRGIQVRLIQQQQQNPKANGVEEGPAIAA